MPLSRCLKTWYKSLFVTGRPLSELKATRANLLRAGFNHWAGLYLRPDTYRQPSITPFKTQARKSIANQGYTVIASIGDQDSDLKGGFMQKGFKLPNPFYHLP
nr:HAD family acid phosphatase [Legionella tunisiensis]